MIKFIEEVLFKGSGGSVGDHSPEWTIVVRKEQCEGINSHLNKGQVSIYPLFTDLPILCVFWNTCKKPSSKISSQTRCCLMGTPSNTDSSTSFRIGNVFRNLMKRRLKESGSSEITSSSKTSCDQSSGRIHKELNFFQKEFEIHTTVQTIWSSHYEDGRSEVASVVTFPLPSRGLESSPSHGMKDTLETFH